MEDFYEIVKRILKKYINSLFGAFKLRYISLMPLSSFMLPSHPSSYLKTEGLRAASAA